MLTRTISVDDELLARIAERLEGELRDYGRLRQSDVARGAETPELAGLLVEKYGSGINKAIEIIFYTLDLPKKDVMTTVDEVQRGIDPEAEANRKRRWDARPAAVSV